MSTPAEIGFNEVVQLIVAARQQAMRAVNTSLIGLYVLASGRHHQPQDRACRMGR